MKNEILKRNNVKISGNGKQPIVFAHSLGCDQNMWRLLTPTFADDYKIFLFDYVGSGKSDVSAYNQERYSNLNGYAQDVLDICNALELENIIFVGHSVSSMIGLLAGIKQPEIFDTMIFIGASAHYLNDEDYKGGFDKSQIDELLVTMEQNYIGWSNFLAPAIMKNPERPELGQELIDDFTSADPEITRQFARAAFFSDYRKDLSKFNIPVLLLQCAEDIIAPEASGLYIHNKLKNSTINFMKASGHCPHVSAPEETISLMKNYLND